MSSQEEIERLIELALKTGEIWVSQDVYDALKDRLQFVDGVPFLKGIRVHISRCVPTRSVVACDSTQLRHYSQALDFLGEW